MLKALSHIAGQLAGKGTKNQSVRCFSPVVNYTCPFAKNTSNVVPGSVPVHYRRRKRPRDGVNGGGTISKLEDGRRSTGKKCIRDGHTV